MKTRNTLLAALGLIVAIGGAASAQPMDPGQARRAEVNGRLENQNARIHEAREEGRFGPRKAYRLHMAERRMRRQERRIAYRHGGHLPLRAQARLNHEENRVSDRIGR